MQAEVYVDSSEGRAARAIDTLGAMIVKQHWSSAESQARLRDARDAGRFETYRELCELVVRDCETGDCTGGQCVHDRILDQFLDAMFESGE